MKKFVVFEAIDGAGKTTLSKRLAEKLNWYWTKEPQFSSDQADKLNLSNDYTREVEFLIDRISHLQLLSTVENNIICDRYIWSGLAYCMMYNKKAFEFSKALYEHSFFTKPTLYVFVKTPVEICYERIYERSGYKQTIDDLQKLYDCYMNTRELVQKHSTVFEAYGCGIIEEQVNLIIKQLGLK